MKPDIAGLLSRAAAFAKDEVRPLAAYFDKGNGVGRDLIGRMAQLGLLGAPLPVKYGGGGAGPLEWGQITCETGKACCSVRSLLTVHTSVVGETLSRLGSETQKQRWLPAICAGKAIGAFALSEPETGSDARSVQTTYTKSGNEYVLNGKKKWITFGNLADFFMVLAGDAGNMTAFIVERDQPGVHTSPIEGLIGNRGSHIAEIRLDNVKVLPEAVVCGEGLGFTHVVNTAMDFGRHSIAWAGLALAEEALECMVAYARTRKQFGVPIGSTGAIRAMIAEATVSVHGARQLCERAAAMRAAAHPENVNETIIAKYFTSRAAVEITNHAVQLHGANGCSSDYTVERLMREAKILEVIEGTSQVLQGVISDFAFRHYYQKQKKQNG